MVNSAVMSCIVSFVISGSVTSIEVSASIESRFVSTAFCSVSTVCFTSAAISDFTSLFTLKVTSTSTSIFFESSFNSSLLSLTCLSTTFRSSSALGFSILLKTLVSTLA